jgi:hypothetical protein
MNSIDQNVWIQMKILQQDNDPHTFKWRLDKKSIWTETL